jgi:hypothetical protein
VRLIVLVGVLLPLTLFAQLNGRVVNAETGEGVAFATISWSPTEGLYTDLSGNFSIERDYTGKSIFVSCVGFKTDTIHVTSSDFLKIELVPHPITLAPIIVSDGKIKPERIGAPRNRKVGMALGAKFGTQYALFIPANKYKVGSLISKLYFNLNSGMFDPVNPKDSYFRIRLYSNGNGEPGVDLLDNMVVKPTKNGGWESIDLSIYRLTLPDNGVFIAMEWLPNTITGTYTYTKEGSKKKYKGMQYGHKLNAHETEDRELKTFHFYPSHMNKWFEHQWPDEIFEGKYYIPCLALEVIEL